ncbi:MAG: hypothetical protein GY711_03610 [bacterium]|nr:hypothetical protein [bacterium]
MNGPEPTTPTTIERTLQRLRGGTPYKAALEALLLDLDEDTSEQLMLLHKESRAAWLPLLANARGRALFLGNAFSGTIPPIAFVGFHLTVVDHDPRRLAFSSFRDREYVPGRTSYIAAGLDARLPFASNSFDLVVLEQGPPNPATGWSFDMSELTRVARSEIVMCVDNRLGYKRSIGKRGIYHVPGPLEYVRGALRAPRGERTLRAYRRMFGPDFERPRAFALYPHARDFSHVVGLDAQRPRLTIGPRERKNKIKLAGKALGLFPVLAPSFALIARRRGGQAQQPRVERVLSALAERIGEERPELDILVATRSNDCLMLTAPHAAVDDPSRDEAGSAPGYWTLHVPLSPQKKRLVRIHHGFLARLRSDFPTVNVPEPLFEGELDGMWLTCERRLAGLTAPNMTGELGATRRTFLDAARDMASLVVREAQPCDAETFEAHVGRSFELVMRYVAVGSTRRALERMRDEARERLIGRSLPLVFYHADLRGKHVQVRRDGSVVGYLDWGASLECFLPYVDLLHLVAHQRKQEERCSSGATWKLVRDRGNLREHEREALEEYVRRVGLDTEVRATIEAIYPVLVAEMAERNWDYSRPRWMHRQFGL